MKIECRNCNTSFEIKEEDYKEYKDKLHCPFCGTWHGLVIPDNKFKDQQAERDLKRILEVFDNYNAPICDECKQKITDSDKAKILKMAKELPSYKDPAFYNCLGARLEYDTWGKNVLEWFFKEFEKEIKASKHLDELDRY